MKLQKTVPIILSILLWFSIADIHTVDDVNAQTVNTASSLFLPIVLDGPSTSTSQTNVGQTQSLIIDEAIDGHALSHIQMAELAKNTEPWVPAENMVRAAAATNVGGEWGSIIPWPHVAVSASNLPDGRIVTWASNEKRGFPEGRPEQTYTAIWDPGTGEFDEYLYESHDMFCAGNVLLQDGRLFVNGGRNGNDSIWTSIFDPNTEQWVRVENMHRGRWYPTSLVMPGDKIFTALGSDGHIYPELYTPGQGWDLLTGINMSSIVAYKNQGYVRSDWWPQLALAPHGDILHMGPTPQMHWIDSSGNGTMTSLGMGIANWDTGNQRGGNIVYDEGKILAIGGGNGMRRYFTVDMNTTTPVVANITSPNTTRQFANVMSLADGDVLMIGGSTYAGGWDDSGSVLIPEIWEPDTDTWTEMNPMAVPRNYHSIALLLPDARVLSAGGGLCGCEADHEDAQVFTPPYLFDENGNLAQRPTINSAPDSTVAGGTIQVSGSDDITRFTMVRMSATTHSVNTDHRFLEIPHSKTGAGAYELTLHSNPNVILPGYWMMFALNDQGVPSIAKTFQVSGTSQPFIANPGDQTNFVGDIINLPLYANDPSGDTLTFGESGLPDGLSLNSNSGLINGTTTTPGVYNVSVSAENESNEAVSASFVWTVSTGQDPNAVYISDMTWVSETNGWGPVERDTTNGDNGANDGSIITLNGVQYQKGVGAHANSEIVINLNGQYGTFASDIGIDDIRLDGLCGSVRFEVYLDDVLGFQSPVMMPSSATQSINLVTADVDELKLVIADAGDENCGDHGDWANARLYLPVSTGPTIANPGDQTNMLADIVNLAIIARDADNDPLLYSSANLPDGLNLNTTTGQITGSPTASGTFNVTISVNDGNGGTANTSFAWGINSPEPVAVDPIQSLPQSTGQPVNFTATASGGNGALQYRWLFGDGTPEIEPSTSPDIAHEFAEPGQYLVQVTVADAAGQEATAEFYQAVYRPHTAMRPNASTSIVYEEREGNDRLWNVNPDNDTVSVFDAINGQKQAEIDVDAGPRVLAMGPNDKVWVTNKQAATISIIDASSLQIVQTVGLPRGSQPFGLVFMPNGTAAYVALEATGQILRFDPATVSQNGSVSVGINARHLAISGNGTQLIASRFITPRLPGEETLDPQVWDEGSGGEVMLIDTGTMSVADTVYLHHSDSQDAEKTGRGIPNYLGPAVISPDGLTAWVPSKQDNIRSGTMRDGRELDFDHTVRSITSRIDLNAQSEVVGSRIDHDNAGVASTALFGRYGNYLFVALETNRKVAVVNAYTASELFRFDVGMAPQGLALSPDGLTLYVHNFMDRTITVHDLTDLIERGEDDIELLATYSAVAAERLTSEVLLGKQLFYDARDTRLAKDSYMSCASCHNDGGHDGRVWDLSHAGEGLRNTIGLNGHAGTGQGRLHWTANFDEVHDFEGQIRSLAGGTGLMSDAAFNEGTRSDPLGDPLAGISSDLDALAAYVSSLTTFGNSPHRKADGSLTSDGLAGKALFESQECASCHVGQGFTDSPANLLHDIGTIKASSGSRIGQALTGIDTPTLRGLWETAPYLHDGSAATLPEAVNAHDGISLTSNQMNQLVAYLNQIDDSEPAPALDELPTIINPGNQTGLLGDGINIQIETSDPNNTNLVYSAVGLPNGLTLNAATGIIAGTLSTVGAFDVTLTISDGSSDTESATWLWTVTELQNSLPILSNPGNQTTTVGTSVALVISASDPDTDPLTFSAAGLPAGLSINNSSGEIGIIPTAVGSYAVSISVDDGQGGSASEVFTWTITENVNNLPSVTTPDNQSNDVGDNITLLVEASDVDGHSLSYSASGLPDGLAMDPNTGAIAGVLNSVGTFEVTVTVMDSEDGTTMVTFTWIVNGSNNRDPILVVPNSQTNQIGESVVLQIGAVDLDGDTLTFGATDLPPGLDITADGRIEGTFTQDGRYDIGIVVDDGRGGHVAATLVWTISQGDTFEPVAQAGPDQSLHDENADGSEPVTLDGSATTDGNDDIVSYEWRSDSGIQIPDGVTTSANFPVGSHVVTLTVTDSNGASSSDTLFVVVTEEQGIQCTMSQQEAEDGILQGDFVVGTDASASGGAFIEVPRGMGAAEFGSHSRAIFCFTVAEAGDYRILAAVKGMSGESNSFFVTVDDAPSTGFIWDIHDAQLQETGYHNDYVNQRNGDDPVEVNLAAGDHMVIVYLREDGTRLDKIGLQPTSEWPVETPETPPATDAPIAWGVLGQVNDVAAVDASDEGPATAPEQLRQLNVTLVSASGMEQEYRQTTQTDDYGRFFFDSMPVGNYTIEVELGDKMWQSAVTASDTYVANVSIDVDSTVVDGQIIEDPNDLGDDGDNDGDGADEDPVRTPDNSLFLPVVSN